MLHVPHVVEEQFPVAHRAIVERTRTRNPGFCHARHHGVQLFAAVLEVAEQFVFSVVALRLNAPGFEFGEAERWRRMESGFVAFREIEVEEEKRVKGQVPKRARRLTGPQPQRLRTAFDRVTEHVDRGMELLPDRRSPKVHHEGWSPHSFAFGVNEWALVTISLRVASQSRVSVGFYSDL